MAAVPINMEQVIGDLGGCGSFQILLVASTSPTVIMSAMSILMMSFGDYNPGWRCLDANATTAVGWGDGLPLTNNASSRTQHDGSTADWSGVVGNASYGTQYGDDSEATRTSTTNQCELYNDCTNVKFTPGVNTVVTEWQLICDKTWIVSFIICIQMVGVLIGSILVGYLGDTFGRKRTLLVATIFQGIVNLAAIASNSWSTFAVVRFLIGIASPMPVLAQIALAVEFVPPKWRAPIPCLPVFQIGCCIIAVLAMTVGDWKHIQLFIAVGSFTSLVPLVWVPESLRWLLVKNKKKEAVAALRKMAALNGTKVNETEVVDSLADSYNIHADSRDCTILQLLLQLMRKGMRRLTFVVGVICMTNGLIYYGLIFGVNSMPGDFFFNLIIVTCSDIPFTVFLSSTLPNLLGRKPALSIFLVLATVCLLVTVGLDLGLAPADDGGLHAIGMLACLLVARSASDGAWNTMITYTGETFPTGMRSTSVAFASWTARIGCVLAPFLVPTGPDTRFVCYSVMAVCELACCLLVLLLPETNGKPLKDVWESPCESERRRARDGEGEELGGKAWSEKKRLIAIRRS